MGSNIRKIRFPGLVALLTVLALWVAWPVFASPTLDGGGPVTETPSPEPTNAPVINQQVVADPTLALTDTPEGISADPPDGGNVDLRPELTETVDPASDPADSAVTSILGFLLCAGVIVVLALLALNFYGSRPS